MIKKFLIYICRLGMYVAIFLGLAWLLLDIEPKEASQRSVENIQKHISRVTGFVGDMNQTGKDMKKVGNYHLGQAADRINGIDPYEKQAQKFNQEVANMR